MRPGLRARLAGAVVLLLALAAGPAARAQDPVPPAEPNAGHAPEARKGRDTGRMPRVRPPSRRESRMAHLHHEEAPAGMLGPYPLTRETSGTAWQPESSAHEGFHIMRGSWTTMVHGWATAVWDNQGGHRGDREFFGASMLMARSHGALGPGTAGLRVMLSGEPGTTPKDGYPLLLQTGESADQRPLIDRQHPHDLVMELAGTYSISPDPGSSVFVYAGLPGEPALGPPVFMHRFSGESFPEAPIGHHWLDSSHITYGVVTAGLVDGPWKLEASRFRGREPDEDRTDIEEPTLDSHSFRISNNPGPDLALQASYGRLHSPEALEPDVDIDRTTVSAILNSNLRGRRTQATIAWGRNHRRPGSKLDAFLVETTARMLERHTWMMRVEQVEKDDLFPPGHARAGKTYQVEKLSGGYAIDVLPRGRVGVSLGGLVSLTRLPDALDGDYGRNPVGGMIYVRVALR